MRDDAERVVARNRRLLRLLVEPRVVERKGGAERELVGRDLLGLCEGPHGAHAEDLEYANHVLARHQRKQEQRAHTERAQALHLGPVAAVRLQPLLGHLWDVLGDAAPEHVDDAGG